MRPVPHVDSVARQQAPAGSYRFVPAQESDGMSFDATLSVKDNQMSASSHACGAFTLRHVTSASLSRKLSVQVQLNGRTHHPNDPLDVRCEALLQWAGHISREYPNLDMWHTAMSRLFAKGALLFADDDFIPVFGFPYDLPTAVDLSSLGTATRNPDLVISSSANEGRVPMHAAYNDIQRECRKDPFLRDKGGWVWGHSLFNKLWSPNVYYSGDFSVAAIRGTFHSNNPFSSQ